jgi:hypothetical protein
VAEPVPNGWVGYPVKKSKPPAAPIVSALRAAKGANLLLFLFGGFEGALGGERFGGALLEFVNPAGGVNKLLLAGVEGVTDVADADDDGRASGTGLDHVAAGATDFGFRIFRMNVSFHKIKGRSSYYFLGG